MQIPHPRAGDIVRVRRRLWHVERVDQFVSCQVVALRGLGPEHLRAVVERALADREVG